MSLLNGLTCSEYRRIISANIARARSSKQLSQTSLHKDAEISHKTLYNIESSFTDCRTFTLFKLAKALNVSVDSLMPSDGQIRQAVMSRQYRDNS